jgi:DNA-binding beta-propeller fold protein YncE
MTAWGGFGSRNGQFNCPWGISTDGDGNVYVADWRNDRIQKFDSQGVHLASYGSSGQGDGQFDRPSGVAVDGQGNIYVADWKNERVQVLGPDGRFVTMIHGDSGISKWGMDYFGANQDEFAERIKAHLEPKPELPAEDYMRNHSAAIEKLFWGPISLKVDDQDRLYVVDSCRHRVQVYETAGARVKAPAAGA